MAMNVVNNVVKHVLRVLEVDRAVLVILIAVIVTVVILFQIWLALFIVLLVGELLFKQNTHAKGILNVVSEFSLPLSLKIAAKINLVLINS